MASFADFASAAKIRDLVKGIAKEYIDQERPSYRYATVQTIDRAARRCTVIFPGDTEAVTVTMGSLQPSAVGQVVRIAGVLGDRFIDDVMGEPYFWQDGSDLRRLLRSPYVDTGTNGAWQTPTFSGTWTNYGSGFTTCQYYLDRWGWVHLKGLVKSGTINTSVFTLPVGYRPNSRYLFAIGAAESGVYLSITAAGTVSVHQAFTTSTAWVSLDGISFPVWDNEEYVIHQSPAWNWHRDNYVTPELYPPGWIQRPDGNFQWRGTIQGSDSALLQLPPPLSHNYIKLVGWGMPYNGSAWQAPSDVRLENQRLTGTPATDFMVLSPLWCTPPELEKQFIAPTLVNSWQNYAAANAYDKAGYWKDETGRVWLKGLIGKAALGNAPFGQVIFTLPAGYRPLEEHVFGMKQSHNGTAALTADFRVAANGQVKAGTAGTNWITLNGASFLAEA